jgi:hypothetical protein
MRSRIWTRRSARSGNLSGIDRTNRSAARRGCVWAIAAASVLLGFGGRLRAQEIPPDLREFLTATAHFSENDLRDLSAGKPVAKVLETNRKSEVAALGAIRIAVPCDFFLAQVDDIVSYKQAQADPAPDIGRFDSPPRPANLEILKLQDRDIDSLRGCRPGNCGLRLPGAAIQRFQKEIRWENPGADISANRLFREFLLARVEDYLKTGDEGLAAYHDKQTPVSLAARFRELVADSPYLGRYAPRLTDCLVRFPQCDSDVQSFLYWSKEKFGHGLRSVISITQVMTDRQPADGNGWIWQASKQLYADHYLDCSLGLTLMADAGRKGDPPAFYLVYLNRSRSDVLKGNLAGLVRGIIQEGASGEMSERLERIRKRMESLWATQASRAGSPPGRE